jgi:hypothetical protein
VPDIAAGIVQVRGIATKVGVRSIVVVEAHDPAVDSVGAGVGSRGSRIKPLVAELDYEKVDVVRWSDSMDRLIGNFIAPNRFLKIQYDEATRQARITLQPDRREPSLLNPTRLDGTEWMGDGPPLWNGCVGGDCAGEQARSLARNVCFSRTLAQRRAAAPGKVTRRT